MGSLPAPTDPIDNHRFYVWQHYGDFLQAEPDEAGLDYWTRQIVDTCSLGVSFNTNNPYCTLPKRVDVSRAFWVAVYPSWFDLNTTGLTNFNPAPYSTPNERWLDEVYSVYLRRRPPHNNPYPDWDSGFKFWFDALNSGGYGNPANQAGVNYIIQAFITSQEYRERFGQP